MNRPFFSAQDFGATGDGKTLDTEFLQRAIDACHTAGGGTVYFSPGIYLTGTLHLKTGVRLYLEAGATILGSTREEDYVPCALREIAGETVSLGCSLIDGADAEDVAIEGRGVIDGSGRAFWKEEMVNAYVRAPKEWRPRALIYLANCRRLRFRDITLRNSPCYTLWLLGCDDAVIDGLTIDNPYDGPNTDALDIDCCRDVRIANCAISAGDDCIALKSDAARLGEDRPCERITVTNCTFSSSACAIRIGYEGDAWIRQCVFSNITIFHTDIGIDLISCLPARQDPCSQINAATRIEDILFENITMSDVNRPLFFWMGNETERPYGGAMRRIMLRNIIATAHNGCYLGGCPEAALADVDINGLRLFIDGEAREASPEIPNLWGGSATPFALDCRYAQNVRINDVMIDWTAACGPWQQQIHTEQVSAFHLENLRSRGAAAVTAQPSVHIIHGQDITLQGCRAEAGTEVFAEFTHCEKGITLFGNDFTEARQGISLEATDAAQVVQVAEITRTGTPTR